MLNVSFSENNEMKKKVGQETFKIERNWAKYLDVSIKFQKCQ